MTTDTAALAEEIRRLLGKHQSEWYAPHRESAQQTIRQLVALLRQCGEAAWKARDHLVIERTDDTNGQTVNEYLDGIIKPLEKALVAISPIIGDEKTLDSSAE